MTAKPHKSLVDLFIVDDDPALCDLLNRVALRMGFAPILCGNGIEFMDKITDSGAPAICFIDIHMDQMDGIETIQQLASTDRRTTIRFITGAPGPNVDSANVIADAKDFQVRPTLYKPFSMIEFQSALEADFAEITA